MRFVADSMLGKLARFLRMLGQDVLFFRDAQDPFLLYTAKETGRILVTRDRGLYRDALRVGVKAVLVRSNHVKEQLRELLEATGFVPARPERCIVCNGPLKKVDRCEIEGLVPDFVLYRNSEFFMCGSCGKVYWQGSHVRNFVRFLGFDPWGDA